MIQKIPLPTVLVVMLILVAVLLPGSSLPEAPGIIGFDKLVHFAMFLTLAIAVELDFKPVGLRSMLLVVFLALAFSAITEALQLLVEGRAAEMLDMLADMAGFGVGLVARHPLSNMAMRIRKRAAKILKNRQK